MLDFAEALSALKDGKNVARKGWGEGEHIFNMGRCQIGFHDKGDVSVWFPVNTDLLSNDWVEV